MTPLSSVLSPLRAHVRVEFLQCYIKLCLIRQCGNDCDREYLECVDLRKHRSECTKPRRSIADDLGAALLSPWDLEVMVLTVLLDDFPRGALVTDEHLGLLCGKSIIEPTEAFKHAALESQYARLWLCA